MATKQRITGKQRTARVRNIAIARQHRKSRKLGPAWARRAVAAVKGEKGAGISKKAKSFAHLNKYHVEGGVTLKRVYDENMRTRYKVKGLKGSYRKKSSAISAGKKRKKR